MLTPERKPLTLLWAVTPQKFCSELKSASHCHISSGDSSRQPQYFLVNEFLILHFSRTWDLCNHKYMQVTACRKHPTLPQCKELMGQNMNLCLLLSSKHSAPHPYSKVQWTLVNIALPFGTTSNDTVKKRNGVEKVFGNMGSSFQLFGIKCKSLYVGGRCSNTDLQRQASPSLHTQSCLHLEVYFTLKQKLLIAVKVLLLPSISI